MACQQFIKLTHSPAAHTHTHTHVHTPHILTHTCAHTHTHTHMHTPTQYHSPSYNLTALTVPTALFTGGQDWLADPQDVTELIPQINTTGKVFYRKNIDKYDHLDFIWGLDAATLVYQDIVNISMKMVN